MSINSSHARRFLAYLALKTGESVSRAHLAGVLFPESPEKRARRALNQTIWRVRHILGRDVVVGDYNVISLGSHVWTDVAEFERRAKSPDVEHMQRAVDVYRGEFWPEGYEDWALLAGERMREEYVSLLGRLTQAHKQAGRYEEALRCARENARMEPLRESVHREIMQLYLILERPAEALQQYETLRALLMEELGVDPSPEVETLSRVIEERIRQARPLESAPVFASETRIPFVGRNQERASVLEAMEQAHQGRGRVVFVEGIPGMGKSRLMDEVREGARWRGMNVGYGQATSIASVYSPLPEAMEGVLLPTCVATLRRQLSPSLLASAAHVWPILGTPGLERSARQLHNALVQVVLTFAQCSPLVLILEDMHNADPIVFDILADLAPRIGNVPLLIVCTYRPLEAQTSEEVWQGFLALDKKAAPLRIALRELEPEERQLFISAALSVRPEEPVVEALAKAAGGVPLSIVEMLRYLHRRGILRRSAEGQWELTRSTLPVPPSIPMLVQQRVRRLPAHLRRVLEMLAVFGERIPTPVVTESVANYSPAVLQDLVRHGFLVTDEESYAFSHALVREAIYQQIDPALRKMLHKQAVDILRTQSPPPWDQMAVHFQEAGMRAAAVNARLQAAKEALRVYAYNRVIEHCSAALSLMDKPDPVICDLWLLRGLASTFSGYRKEARDSLARALYLARCLGDTYRLAKGCLLTGREAFRAGRYAMAQRFLQRAYPHYAALDDIAGMVESRIALADVLETCGDLESARAYIQETTALAQQHGLHQQHMRALSLWGMIEARLGHVEEAQGLYTQAAKLAEETGDLYVLGMCLNGLGLLALDTRDHGRASETFSKVLEIAKALGDPHNESVTILNIAVAAGNAGLLGTAYQQAQGALEKARASGNRRSEVLTLLLLGTLNTAFGEFSQAEEYLQEGTELAKRIGFRAAMGFGYRDFGIWAREQGNFQEAVKWGEESLQFFLAQTMLEKVPMAAYQLGCTLLAAEEFQRAEEVLALGLQHTRASLLEAFLRVALGCARVHVGRVAQGRPSLGEGMSVLERVETDEYLHVAWYHIFQAAQRFDEHLARKALRRAYVTLQTRCLEVPERYHRTFLHRVLSHRLITRAWLDIAPRPIERMRLQLASLKGDGQVAVVWTVDAGDEDALVEAQYGPIALRRHRLKRLLQEAEAQGARPTHKALAEALGVSVPTVRRDLRTLV